MRWGWARSRVEQEAMDATLPVVAEQAAAALRLVGPRLPSAAAAGGQPASGRRWVVWPKGRGSDAACRARGGEGRGRRTADDREG